MVALGKLITNPCGSIDQTDPAPPCEEDETSKMFVNVEILRPAAGVVYSVVILGKISEEKYSSAAAKCLVGYLDLVSRYLPLVLGYVISKRKTIH